MSKGTGLPLGNLRSHSSQPVLCAQGSTRKDAGSATITASAAPSNSGMPSPAPGVNTGNTVLLDVSFASSELGKPTPLFSAAGTSAAAMDFERRMPCWSANENRTVSIPLLLIS